MISLVIGQANGMERAAVALADTLPAPRGPQP